MSIKENIGDKSIEAVVNRYIDTKVTWANITQIGLLGIDEISLKTGCKDYVTLITSTTDEGIKIISIIKGREKSYVKGFLSSIPQKLKKTIIAVYTCCGRICKQIKGGARNLRIKSITSSLLFFNFTDILLILKI